MTLIMSLVLNLEKFFYCAHMVLKEDFFFQMLLAFPLDSILVSPFLIVLDINLKQQKVFDGIS